MQVAVGVCDRGRGSNGGGIGMGLSHEARPGMLLLRTGVGFKGGREVGRRDYLLVVRGEIVGRRPSTAAGKHESGRVEGTVMISGGIMW